MSRSTTYTNRFHLQFIILISTLMFALSAAPAAGATVPSLACDTEVSHAGYYRLSWHAALGKGSAYELQEATSKTFAHPRIIYHGPDLASLISGRANGTYYYRVRGISRDGTTGGWSEDISVRVQHQPLDRAFAFFGIGALVFLATLGLVIGGNLAHGRRGEEDDNG